ncbi:ABC transporter permease [Calidifontibacter terrae]
MSAIHSETLSPRIHVGSWADSAVSWLTDHGSWFFTGLADAVTWVVGNIDDGLRNIPIVLLVILFALIAWWARGWRAAIGSVIGFVLIDALGAFPHTLDTLAQILVASVLGVLISVPLGILAARSDRTSRVVRPVMDFMQTLPAYVYLLPFLFLMGLGVPSAVLATIIFAMPPGVRLAELGIRQVDSEILEAGQSFGATKWEVLRGIQLPLALTTIMAGVNQVIMLALSMVVIGGIVGAPGLGSDVMSALSQLQVGPGVEAGLAVVILAIYLDRVTDALAKPQLGLRSELATFKQQRAQRDVAVAEVA